MPGFRPEPRTYKLRFIDDEELAGLEVKMGSVSVEEYNRMMKVSISGAPDIDTENKDIAALRREISAFAETVLDSNDWLINLFASRLLEWNLEDQQGKKVPTTKKAVMAQERLMISKIINAWQSAMVRIPDPLSQQSPNGKPSEEESLGLDRISESQQS